MKKQVREQEELETHLLRELAVLNYVRHENMLEYIGAYNEVDPQGATHAVYIVTELAAGGDLMSLLLSEHELGWKFLTKICHGAAAGLEYLHSHNLIHRDIKSSNLLLDACWKCKIADFGLCREVAPDDEQMSTCGTDEYMAPELHFDEPYGFSVDVFSFGMVLVECTRGERSAPTASARARPRSASRWTLTACARSRRSAARRRRSPSSRASAAATSPMMADHGRRARVALRPERRASLRTTPRPTRRTRPRQARCSPRERATAAPPPPRWRARGRGGRRARPTRRGRGRAARRRVEARAMRAPPRPSAAPPRAWQARRRGGAGAPREGRAAGWLYKRNKTGFRNWKKRWFELRDGCLSWYALQTDPSDGKEPRGTIELRGCFVERAHPTFHRWQILNVDDTAQTVNDTRLYNREIAAANEPEMRLWIAQIQTAIDAADAARGGGGGAVAPPRAAAAAVVRRRHRRRVSAPRRGCSPCRRSRPVDPRPRAAAATRGLGQRLRRRGCRAGRAPRTRRGVAAAARPRRSAKFDAAGYTSLVAIREGASRPTTRLGVGAPIRQRVLRLAASRGGCARSRSRSPATATSATSSSTRQGAGATGARRSTCATPTCALNARLRACSVRRRGRRAPPTARRRRRGAAELPPLPGKGIKMVQNQRDPAFIAMRKHGLESYLRQVATLTQALRDESGAHDAAFEALLEFLELGR